MNAATKQERTSKQVYNPTIILTGIKKRQRKVKRHTFRGTPYTEALIEKEGKEIIIEKLKESAKKAMQEYMRETHSGELSIQLETWNYDEQGRFESSSFMMFQDNERIKLDI